MPRFIVKQMRACPATYLIEAEDEESARRGYGEIIDSFREWVSSYTLEIVSVEEVPNDTEELL